MSRWAIHTILFSSCDGGVAFVPGNFQIFRSARATFTRKGCSVEERDVSFRITITLRFKIPGPVIITSSLKYQLVLTVSIWVENETINVWLNEIMFCRCLITVTRVRVTIMYHLFIYFFLKIHCFTGGNKNANIYLLIYLFIFNDHTTYIKIDSCQYSTFEILTYTIKTQNARFFTWYTIFFCK